MPRYLLALNYWLHLIATVTWVGGLVLMALVVSPAIRSSLEDAAARRADLSRATSRGGVSEGGLTAPLAGS